jgi:PleD family two-component response regulator
MRASVEATPLPGIPDRATISIGVATRDDVFDIAAEWEALLKEADAHLYRAKSSGRNRVVSH